MRVVHVLAPVHVGVDRVEHAARSSGVGAFAACGGAIALSPEVRHDVLVLGTPSDARGVAKSLPEGVRVDSLCPPAGMDWMVFGGVQRRIRGTDHVWAWDERSARAAGVSSVVALPAGLAAFGPGVRRGSPAWPPVVALVCDPAPLGDARSFVFTMGLLDVMDDAAVGVMPARAGGSRAARRFYGSAPVGWELRVTPELGVWDGVTLGAVQPVRGASMTRSTRALIASAHAAGVAVVCADAAQEPDLYPESVLGRLAARSPARKDIAGVLLGLVEDERGCAEIGDAVRAHVRSDAARTRVSEALAREIGMVRA